MNSHPTPGALERWRQRFHSELNDNVLPFWLEHSLDHQHGGYFNCLDRDGSVYDTTKHIWLQGREVWMFSKLHNATEASNTARRGQLLAAAELGARFLRQHARRRDDGRVFFALTADGRPMQLQRKMFSECFYVMALAEYARASGDATARTEAREVFAQVIRYAQDPSLVGRPVFAGNTPVSSLAVPMILLNLIAELKDPGETTWAGLEQWCVDRIAPHVRPELGLVLETVSNEGTPMLDSSEGRLVNPGHAIEAGWFMMEYAEKNNRHELIDQSLKMIDWSLDFGWDKEFGGIYYFLDAKGFSPTQLEWDMKLWWPHCETLVALLMAYRVTGDPGYWRKFETIADYTFDHFADTRFGEWFGYLNRRGEVSMRFKGGPYKGCFHVPRALFLCERELQRILSAPALAQGA